MESLDQSDLVYLNNANDGKAKADAVVAFVLSVLTQKYGLAEGDQITPDGTIIRVGSYKGQAAEQCVICGKPASEDPSLNFKDGWLRHDDGKLYCSNGCADKVN